MNPNYVPFVTQGPVHHFKARFMKNQRIPKSCDREISDPPFLGPGPNLFGPKIYSTISRGATVTVFFVPTGPKFLGLSRVIATLDPSHPTDPSVSMADRAISEVPFWDHQKICPSQDRQARPVQDPRISVLSPCLPIGCFRSTLEINN